MKFNSTRFGKPTGKTLRRNPNGSGYISHKSQLMANERQDKVDHYSSHPVHHNQEMVKGLQLVSLYHNNFLVILNFFTSSNDEVLQEISAEVFLHDIYHFANLWARDHKLDRVQILNNGGLIIRSFVNKGLIF